MVIAAGSAVTLKARSGEPSRALHFLLAPAACGAPLALERIQMVQSRRGPRLSRCEDKP